MDDTSNKTSKYQDINDKRKYPRIEQSGDVRLSMSGTKSCAASMFDISPDGMQVRFNRDIAIAIKPVIEEIIKKKSGEIRIDFILPLANEDKDLLAYCRPIYMHKVDNDLHAMGMQFTRIDSPYRKILKRFIEISLEPL